MTLSMPASDLGADCGWQHPQQLQDRLLSRNPLAAPGWAPHPTSREYRGAGAKSSTAGQASDHPSCSQQEAILRAAKPGPGWTGRWQRRSRHVSTLQNELLAPAEATESYTLIVIG